MQKILILFIIFVLYKYEGNTDVLKGKVYAKLYKYLYF